VRILRRDASPQLRAPEGGRYLYVLADPRDGNVRWVGGATLPVTRVRKHCTPDARDWTGPPEKSAWIDALCPEGFQPVMILLAVASKRYVLTLEDALIDKLRAKGARLFNRGRWSNHVAAEAGIGPAGVSPDKSA